MSEEEEIYRLAPGVILMSVLADFGFSTERFTPTVAGYVVEEFFKQMERHGYVAKSSEAD